jgi:hypothetical protein
MTGAGEESSITVTRAKTTQTVQKKRPPRAIAESGWYQIKRSTALRAEPRTSAALVALLNPAPGSELSGSSPGRGSKSARSPTVGLVTYTVRTPSELTGHANLQLQWRVFGNSLHTSLRT